MNRPLTLSILLAGLVTASVTLQAEQFAAPSAVPAPDTFEAVSIKTADPDGPRGYYLRPGGRLDSQGQTLLPIIAAAYRVRGLQIIGGPDWMRRDLFTVQTTASGTPDAQAVAAMLRNMLADRFKLVAHVERRELPVYVLTVARSDGRLGPNLVARTCEPGAAVAVTSLPATVARTVPAGTSSVPCGTSLRIGGGFMTGVALDMPRFAQIIEQFWINTPVLEKTGLTGRYDVTVENMVNQWGDRAPTVDGAPSDLASLPAALSEQLGLRLEQRREPADVVVIDRLERPTQN